MKTLLANGLSTFFINGKPDFSNGPRSLPKNPPGCPISYIWVFDNFVLQFYDLILKLYLSLQLPITFDEVTSEPFLISILGF